MVEYKSPESHPRISHWCRAGPRSWMVVTRRLTRRQPYDQGLGKPFVFLSKAGYEILISRAGTLGGVGWVVIKYVNPAQFRVVLGFLFMYIPFETGRNSFWNDLEASENANSVRGCHNLMFCLLFDLFWMPVLMVLQRSCYQWWHCEFYHDGKPLVLSWWETMSFGQKPFRGTADTASLAKLKGS